MSLLDRRQLMAAAGAAALAPAAAWAQPSSEDAKLRALLDRIFEEQLDDSPEQVTGLGLDKGPRAAAKSQLDDYSAEAKARFLEARRRRVASLTAIDRGKLSAASRVDLDTVLYINERSVRYGDRYRFGSVGGNFSPYVISQRTGVYQDIPDFLDSQHKVETAADADAYLARLKAFAVALGQDLGRARTEFAAGVTPPDFVCDLTLGQLKALRDQPAASTILATSLAGKAKAAGLSASYGEKAAALVQAEIFPALDRQIALFQELRPKASKEAGVGRLPGGAEYYADAVKASTTTELSPQEVHQLGLTQVAEITGRIDAILKGQGMTQGSVSARLTALNRDPKQLYADSDAGRAKMLADLNGQIVEIYKKLPTVFATLPKAKVEVRRVPVFIQDGASNGYYQSAALDGSRPAAFYINLKDVGDWPRYNLPTLAYHETTPGHHQQIALAQENTAIPLVRRTGGGLSAFTEGWALYAEQLADEMGAYDGDPLGRAGYLQSLLFRAARLVVDTGIHSKRWSREQATAYMVETVGYAEPRARREVERYCASPGQACSYKVGHTVWVRVRDQAKAKLGARFNLKAFHDAGLLSGAMPLTVLERHIGEWAAAA